MPTSPLEKETRSAPRGAVVYTPANSLEEEVDEKFISPTAPLREGPAQPPAPAQGFKGMFSSFRHRNYRLWFGGQLISVIGTWMQSIAQGWLVYEISRSEFALGFVSFAAAIPVLFISPFGGVITDAFPKRTMLVITQSVAMLMALVLAALSFTGVVQVWHIYILAVILGVVNAFDAPARQAFVVEMVAKEDIPNAIALNSMMFNSARVVGPALGGLLLGWLGSSWAFLLNGLSYIAVIAGLLMMVVPRQPIPKKVEQPLRQFKEGLLYARQHAEILGMLLLSGVFSVFGMSYAALMPAFVRQQLNSDATGYGMINAAIGAGAVLGAVYVAYKGGAARRGVLVAAGSIVYPVLLIALGFNTLFPVALLLGMAMGTGFMLLLNSINSLLQMRVDDRMRGRIMSLYMVTFLGFAPFGSLLAGSLAERIHLNFTFALMGLAMLVLSLLILLRTPTIRKLR